jgi:signal recognition particle receptor subunit beta
VGYERSEGGAAATKIIISGAFGAGNTTFVGAVSEIMLRRDRRSDAGASS